MLSLLTRGRCSDIAGGRNWFWLLRHWSEVWVWERPVVFCLNHVPRMRCPLVTSQLWPRLVITFPGPRNTNITRSRPPFCTNARTPPPQHCLHFCKLGQPPTRCCLPASSVTIDSAVAQRNQQTFLPTSELQPQLLNEVGLGRFSPKFVPPWVLSPQP